MIGASKAGIEVFATGGIGGVHRGVADTWGKQQSSRGPCSCSPGTWAAGVFRALRSLVPM
jgi:hypothetical protein